YIADQLFYWGIIASKSENPQEYDNCFERMVRAVRISVSRNSGIEGIIKEIENTNFKVTQNFYLDIYSILLDFYSEIINTNTPFEKRRDLDSKIVAAYYAGRNAGNISKMQVIDPEKRRYELCQKYTLARSIAEKIFHQIFL
ncbi:MAG: hypothetical protein QXE31_05410, partial [Candidatus Woesearchaeota archaeon]